MTSLPNIPERDLELLSAYLDGELSDRDRRALEERLAAESDLRRALDELRVTVRLLNSLPRLKAPRSFALDPAQFGRRASWWQRVLASGALLQWSGALGTAASIILVVLGLTLGRGDSEPAQDAQAPSATLSAAPAAASLPTPLPVTPTLAPSPLPPMASELDGAEADIAAESAEEAEPGLAEAPMAAPPVPLTESEASTFAGQEEFAPTSPLSDSAASTFAGPEEFAPPSAASPLPSELEAPQIERFAAPGSAADTADEADDAATLRSGEGAAAVQAPHATIFPPPTATAGVAAQKTADMIGDVTEDFEAASPAEAPAHAEPSEPGPRWWLVALGAAGMAISVILFLVGRRQAAL